MELYYWLIKYVGLTPDRANQIQKILSGSNILTCKQLCEGKELALSLLNAIELEEWEAQVFFDAFHELRSGKELIWVEIDDDNEDTDIAAAKNNFLLSNMANLTMPEFITQVEFYQSQTHIPLSKPTIQTILLAIINFCQANKQYQNQLVQSQSVFPFLRNLFEHIQLSNNTHLITLTLQTITALIYDNPQNQRLFGLGKGDDGTEDGGVVASWQPMSQCELLAILMEKYVLLEEEENDNEEEEVVTHVEADALLDTALVPVLPTNTNPKRQHHNPQHQLIPLYEAMFQVLEHIILLPINKLMFTHFFPFHANVLSDLLFSQFTCSSLLTEHLLVILTSFLEDGEYYWLYSIPSGLDLVKELFLWYVEKPGSIAILQHICEYCIALFNPYKKMLTQQSGTETGNDANDGMEQNEDEMDDEQEELDGQNMKYAGISSNSPTHSTTANYSSSKSLNYSSSKSLKDLQKYASKEITAVSIIFMDSIQEYILDTLLPYAYQKIGLDECIVQMIENHIDTSMTIVEVSLHLITSLIKTTSDDKGTTTAKANAKKNTINTLNQCIQASKLRNRKFIIEPILYCLQTKPEYMQNGFVVSYWLQYVYYILQIEEQTRPTAYYNLYEFLNQPMNYIQTIIKIIQLHQSSSKVCNEVFHYGIGILILLAGEHEETWVKIAKEDGISVLLLILKLKALQSPPSAAIIPTKKKKTKATSSPVLSRRTSSSLSMFNQSSHAISTSSNSSPTLRRMSSKALLMHSPSASTAPSSRSSFRTSNHHLSLHSVVLTTLAAHAFCKPEEDEVTEYHRQRQAIVTFYKSSQKSLQALLAVAIAHPTICKVIEDQKGIEIMVQLLGIHGEYSKELMCTCVPVLSKLYQNRSSIKSNQQDDKICEQFLCLLKIFFQKNKALEEKKKRLTEQHFLDLHEEGEADDNEIQKMEEEEQNDLECSLEKCLEVIAVLSSTPTNYSAFRQALTLHKDLMSVLKQFTQDHLIRKGILLVTLDIIMQLIGYDPSHQIKFIKEGICKVLITVLQTAGKVSIYMTTKICEVFTILAIDHRELLGELGVCEQIITLCQYFCPMKKKKKPAMQQQYDSDDESEEEEDDLFEDEEERHKAINDLIHHVSQVSYNLSLNSLNNKYRFLEPSLQTLPYLMSLMRDPEISNHIKQEVKDTINIIKFD